MKTKLPQNMMAIPAAFFKTLTHEDWLGIVQRRGYLDAEQCARLWHMTDRQNPPETAEILFNAEDCKRFIRDLKRRKKSAQLAGLPT